ncbi:hypothetical protein BT96DRAFT_1061792 [Gymnopus androsaceus JB14]|uniref:Uncharacterized protein n=1 Tax=Gymnopus androsaceus JB14 TaxID=1447944 RepID=A0A6A4H0Q3_9AGAR|nr:hypothetical protein BT96DRAFT_1061792 [Gymnopus androsaceus JB14]
MYVYVGKLDWFDYAKNECITVVTPAGFTLQEPVCVYWQWTVDGSGHEKANVVQEGAFKSVVKTASEYRIGFQFDYYSFEGSVSGNFGTLSLIMSNPQGDTAPISLSLKYSDSMRAPSALVFTGKLNWFEYATNEMVTLIIPDTVRDNEPVVLSYQWTKDNAGISNNNYTVRSKLQAVSTQSNGNFCAQFDDGHYTFTLHKTDERHMLSMTNPFGDRDQRESYYLTQTDFLDAKKVNIFLVIDPLAHLSYLWPRLQLISL